MANKLWYDREVLKTILVYHYRKDMTSCGCGWAELGRSWPEHILTVLEESMRAYKENDGDT